MKKFLDTDFLLKTDTAKKLYHDYASTMPIIDYHCHINPKEIWDDVQFENITRVWLGGDHYKWRYMRSMGVEEQYITGNASDKDKFLKWAEVLQKAIGNPLYHWSHLELKRYFGFDGYITKDNAEQVWELCNAKLNTPSMSVRNIIKSSNVKLICTTDDPVDSLEYHQKIAQDDSFDVVVLPAWRPDKAMNIEKVDFSDYIKTLETVCEVTINSFASLIKAMSKRMDYFERNGCNVSDHGIDYVTYSDYTDEEIQSILAKALSGNTLTESEIVKYKTAFMLEMGKQYSKRNWIMQLHYGCKRNNNTAVFNKIGADTGFDCISNYTPADQLANFLDKLTQNSGIPKTIIYSLNPNDNAVIGTIIGCFQGDGVCGKIQHGSAWWFNDHKEGMRDQLISLANLGALSTFVGMLTDSRSFLSYTRHEYFRRIMCDLFGDWVENGEYPADFATLGEIVKDISYNNTLKYFDFQNKGVK